MTYDELRKFLGDLEKKLLAPKRYILFYRAADHAEYTRHMSAYSVKDAYDSFMLRNGDDKKIRVMHIEPWTEDCEEWRPWEAQPFPLRDGKFHINRG